MEHAPPDAPARCRAAPADEGPLLARLRGGDAAAFGELVDGLHPLLSRLAQSLLQNPAVAEEVVQEAWARIIDALPAFEGRSSLRTWASRIVTNCAHTRGEREGRSVPFSSLSREDEAGEGETFDPSWFSRRGFWASPPPEWPDPGAVLLAKETSELLRRELSLLPAAQRAVVTLRDIDGLEGAEVCEALGITEANQRVLLHRGRSRLRAALERHVMER